MNISEETINILNELYYISFTDSNINSTTPLNATHLSIGFEKFNGKETDSNGYSNYIGKTIKCPNKKEITLEWILSKLNTDNTFENFCEKFNKFIEGKGLNAYPTSYGIGVFSLFGGKSIVEAKLEIETTLNFIGIKYTNEYSEAGWVFRYKISKAKENIDTINTWIKQFY